jgi:hypothetical protein
MRSHLTVVVLLLGTHLLGDTLVIQSLYIYGSCMLLIFFVLLEIVWLLQDPPDRGCAEDSGPLLTGFVHH